MSQSSSSIVSPTSPASLASAESAGQSVTQGQSKPLSVMVIEDNVLLAYEVAQLLAEAGFDPVTTRSTYKGALETVDRMSPDLCVLDLDLGSPTPSRFGPGYEGRRLLSVLNSRKIKTVVYSAFTRIQHQLEQLHSTIVIVDKVEPTERVIEALHQLQAVKFKA